MRLPRTGEGGTGRCGQIGAVCHRAATGVSRADRQHYSALADYSRSLPPSAALSHGDMQTPGR